MPPIHLQDPLSAMHGGLDNAFVIETHRLLNAPATAGQSQTQNAAQSANTVATAAEPSPAPEHFNISSNQIIRLIRRYQLQSLTFDQIINIPRSQLAPEERVFIDFLRRNKQAFAWISRLDGQAGLSEKDIRLAARIAGDDKRLSLENFKYLASARKAGPTIAQHPIAENAFSRLTTQDLIETAQKGKFINQPWQTVLDKNLLNAQALNAQQQLAIKFFQSPSIAHLLPQITQPFAGKLTPDALRVLTSLIFNPLVYGYAPIAYYASSPLTYATVHAIQKAESADRVDPNKEHTEMALDPDDAFNEDFTLHAKQILIICHQLSPQGRVTLQQLRQYHPQSAEHQQIVNLLRQSPIFEALAGLDHDSATLSDDDILKALHQGSVVIDDRHKLLIEP